MLMGVALIAGMMTCSFTVQAETIYDSPYVSFAPDGKAWTTNAGDMDMQWYGDGETVETGISSAVREPEVGEHYYLYNRSGTIPIGKWKVVTPRVDCCHNSYPPIIDPHFHGIFYVRHNCFRYHYSGWNAYCADCGGEIETSNIYMSREAAETIDYFEIHPWLDYYYLCPFCSNLEQGIGFKAHTCKAISANQYKVSYHANTAGIYGGYMPDSYHMYNNATEYEGKTVTPITHLTKNAYFRNGYEFVGWNTRADGSGRSFADEAEIRNLTDADCKDGGIVTLYAQWRKSVSTLKINAGEGSYNGNSGITTVKQEYLSSYKVNKSLLKAPAGYTVSFRTNGGNEIAPITGKRHFKEWICSNPFHGKFADDMYTFLGTDGVTDTLTADYEWDAIILPEVSKAGSSFGGWYYDRELTKPAGGAGERLIATADTVLYASWVDLKLFSKENYAANSAKGAVDLSWTQPDQNNKTYKVYQSRDNSTWKLITSASDIGNQTTVDWDFVYTGSEKEYTVPYSGIYRLTAYGAQGSNYGAYNGGYGGSAFAEVWLQKGEKITYAVGGQNGYNGGGIGSVYGNGGGSTIVTSDRQGILLIAGGGGSASESGNGGAGGSSAGLRADNLSAGASGQTGGGAGHVGGNSGEYIVHTCNDSCYRTDQGTVIADLNFYAAGNAATSNTGSYGIGRENQSNYVLLFSHLATSPATGTLEAGSKSSFITTPYSGTLNFTAETYYVRGDVDDTDFVIYVYDKDTDALLYRADADTLSHTETTSKQYLCERSANCSSSRHRRTITTWTYNDQYVTGSCVQKPEFSLQQHDGTWRGYQGETDIVLNCKFPIPENTNGVYLKGYIKIEGGGSFGIKISDVTYSYDSTTKICGYTDGQVISSKPAYGGSSYVNTGASHDYSLQAGVRTGNGAFSIHSESVGYLETLSLKNITATDYAVPDKISAEAVTKESLSGTRVKVNWQKPKDNGTDYYHVAESYLQGSTAVLCRSNVTKNTLTSGIKGYYVLTDMNASTVVTASNSSFTGENSRTVPIGTQAKYLHIAAVDKVGNIGGTVHVKIEAKDVAWKLYTEQLSVEGADNTYATGGGRKWYVRADGSTPFTLLHNSFMDGPATVRYQPNYMIFESVAEGDAAKNIIYAPSVAIQEDAIRMDASGIFYSVEGSTMLVQYPYSDIVRSQQNRKLQGAQAFTLDPDAAGKEIEVIPIVGAKQGEKIVYSDYAADKANSITIIGDGEAPVISGLEILENQELINRNDGTIVLQVTATDDLSGIKDFYLEITNTDNAGVKTYTPEEDGSIRIEITTDEPIFSGDFIVTGYAADNVGNETEVSYSTTEFALQTEIERILQPHDAVFKCGESGILTITTWGYADRVEIEFPDTLTALNPELNGTYVYTENPGYKKQEQLQFMIPLNTPGNQQYVITVRAYKGDKKLEDYPSLSIIAVDGSVLDELRTRLR